MYFLASLLALLLICSYFTLRFAGLSNGCRWRNANQSAYWRKQPLRTTTTGALYLDQASRIQDRGNWVLNLVGEPYAMGFQHGRLLREEIRLGVVRTYASPIDQIPALKNKPQWLRRLALFYLDLRVYAPLERHAPRQYLEELVGLADGAKLPYRAVFRANFLSDLKMVMLPNELKRQQGFSGPKGECSSVIIGGARTANGHLLFGRNTDYVGGDLWCAQQTIIYYRPTHGYSYVSVTTAGMLKCNSAMNEHGLTLGGHFMGFAGARSAGQSFSLLEHEIMRSCREVGEAQELLASRKLAGSFAFALASAQGEALVLEADSSGVEVQPMRDQQLIVTNCASTAAKQRADLLAINHVMQANIQGRVYRAKSWLASANQLLSPADMAQLMGDRIDSCSTQERASASTVGFKDNVTSMVFDPHNRIFWVATGPAPACDNEYLAYGLSGPLTAPALRPYAWCTPQKLKALRLYMRLLVELAPLPLPTVDLLGQLDSIIQLDAEEPRYLLALARLHSQLENWASVLQAVERVKNLSLSTNEDAMAQLLSGLAYTRLGKANLAERQLAGLTNPSDSTSWLQVNRLLQALAKRISQGKKVPLSMWRLDNEILE